MISKVCKMIFDQVEGFHRKALFYTCFKKSLSVENLLSIVTKLKTVNTKKKAKSIWAFDFTISNATVPHNLLIKVLSEVINFVFKLKN